MVDEKGVAATAEFKGGQQFVEAYRFDGGPQHKERAVRQRVFYRDDQMRHLAEAEEPSLINAYLNLLIAVVLACKVGPT
jgi:hypothetical protein